MAKGWGERTLESGLKAKASLRTSKPALLLMWLVPPKTTAWQAAEARVQGPKEAESKQVSEDRRLEGGR